MVLNLEFADFDVQYYHIICSMQHILRAHAVNANAYFAFCISYRSICMHAHLPVQCDCRLSTHSHTARNYATTGRPIDAMILSLWNSLGCFQDEVLEQQWVRSYSDFSRWYGGCIHVCYGFFYTPWTASTGSSSLGLTGSAVRATTSNKYRKDTYCNVKWAPSYTAFFRVVRDAERQHEVEHYKSQRWAK